MLPRGHVTWGAWAANRGYTQSILIARKELLRGEGSLGRCSQGGMGREGVGQDVTHLLPGLWVLPLLPPWPIGMPHTPAWVC